MVGGRASEPPTAAAAQQKGRKRSSRKGAGSGSPPGKPGRRPGVSGTAKCQKCHFVGYLNSKSHTCVREANEKRKREHAEKSAAARVKGMHGVSVP